MRQRALLFKRLEVSETMRTFLTQQLGSDEELHTKIERAESVLAATQKAITNGDKLLKEAEEEREMAKFEALRIKEGKETVEAKCKEAEQEKDQLKNKLESFEQLPLLKRRS